MLSAHLEEADPTVYEILQKVRLTYMHRHDSNTPQEKNRQKHFINLIPSENFTSQAVLDALGSVMQSMSIP